MDPVDPDPDSDPDPQHCLEDEYSAIKHVCLKCFLFDFSGTRNRGRGTCRRRTVLKIVCSVAKRTDFHEACTLFSLSLAISISGPVTF